MASEALIRNHIDGIIAKLAEDVYRNWVSVDLQEIENNSSINSGFRSDRNELKDEAATLEDNLNRFAASTAYDYSKLLRSAVQSLNRYQEFWERAQRRYSRSINTTQQLCRELEENLDGYIPDVETAEVLDQIQREPLTATLPVIGPIVIDLADMKKRVARLGFTGIESYIESRLDAKDYSSFARRTEELVSDCRETIPEIEALRQDLNNVHLSDLRRLQPLASSAVNHLSSLSVRSSPLIREFSQALTEVLGLAHTIEIDEPDISRDQLFAQLLSACDYNNRSQVVELAEILGLDAQQVESMDTTQLCRLLIDANFG